MINKAEQICLAEFWESKMGIEKIPLFSEPENVFSFIADELEIFSDFCEKMDLKKFSVKDLLDGKRMLQKESKRLADAAMDYALKGNADAHPDYEKVIAYGVSTLEKINEAIAYQRTLVYWIKKRQDKLRMPFYVEPIKGMTGSKVDRIRGLQPYFASNKVRMKADMGELERELLSFPNGSHDDIIDALSMQVGFWYQIGEEEERHKKIEVSDKNLMTGESVINELVGRAKNLNRYPYDMGLNAEAARIKQLREYNYV